VPDYTQADRPIRIKTKLGETELLLQRFSGSEGISIPFEFQVDMLSENPSVDLTSLLKTPAAITLRLADGSERFIHGRFNRLVELGRGQANLTVYQGTIVPWLWFLSLHFDCRIFQEKTPVEIIEQVFKDQGFTDYDTRLQKTYVKRDYCVQYRETDLNFVSRLMESEGIFYFFEHREDKHTLVLADSPSNVQDCPQQSNARFGLAHHMTEEDDLILEMGREENMLAAKVSLTDYNFETPSTDLMANVPSFSSQAATGEEYDYPGKYGKKDDGETYAKVRVEEWEAGYLTVRGTSYCRDFRSGYKFKLSDHFRADMNREYTLVAVHHSAGENNYVAPHAEPFKYENSFEAIPYSVPYRPPHRARKPLVYGSQTARVVGKSGEEIWVDKYGRVKVQFFWDRKGTKDENSSCWIRVSQIWAGKNWGWMTIPRIGQEVVVDFLEGDPDRPLITGRVYNADQMPPYTLPDNQTQSGIKSRSSKGGGTADFNEIRFEDKKGSEMVTVHAQKDMETFVENDDTQTVQHNRTIEVDGTHTETITGDTTIEIKQGNHSFTIDQGNDSLVIKMGNKSTGIKMGNESTKLDLGKSEKEAMQSIELKVGQSSVKLDQMGVTIKGMMISIEGQIQVQVKGLMTQVNGDAMLQLKGGITMINT
jgi:type VI secretion system secreted protein VgrG